MQEGSEIHFQALLSSYLQENRTCSGVWLLHPPPTSSNQVNTFPTGQKEERAVCDHSAAGGRCVCCSKVCVLPREGVCAAQGGFGSGQHSRAHTNCHQPCRGIQYPLLCCLHRGCKKKMKPFLMISWCHCECGQQGDNRNVAVVGMTPQATELSFVFKAKLQHFG